MTENDWNRLLQQIAEGRVVPVVGARLLAGPDGESTIQRTVAEGLLDRYDVDPAARPPLPPFGELNAAVSHLLASRASKQDLYVDVHQLLAAAAADPAAVPQPLRQLAQITDFRLYVTMTCDTMLAGCLRQRGPVDEIVHAPKLMTNEWRDLASDPAARGEASMLYMFGKARAAPMFAIHDEDILEYAHNAIARGSNVPVSFLTALHDSPLLLLGCGLPDWLGRFFIRLTNNGRLSEKTRREWIVEPPQPGDGLGPFLESFSSSTKLLPAPSLPGFVDELHRRWTAARGPAAAAAGAGAAPPATRAPAVFFVSYSRGVEPRSDLPRAQHLSDWTKGRLGATADEIWLDKTNIEPGNDFKQVILEGIGSCRCFVPLLSKALLERRDAFVFREWTEAVERTLQRRPSARDEFVLPVIVDADYVPADFKPHLPPEWRGIDLGHAPEGTPDERTGRRLRDLLRKARGGTPS